MDGIKKYAIIGLVSLVCLLALKVAWFSLDTSTKMGIMSIGFFSGFIAFNGLSKQKLR